MIKKPKKRKTILTIITADASDTVDMNLSFESAMQQDETDIGSYLGLIALKAVKGEINKQNKAAKVAEPALGFKKKGGKSEK